MSIEQIEVIDAIGIDKETDEVVLTISDHLPWDDEHMFLLQDKLNTYLEFIESEQLNDVYPEALNRSVRINITCAYEPSDFALEFLQNVKNIGVNLTYYILKR